MRIYNVILKKDVDYDSFWNDMETETQGILYIPNRKVAYTNERVGSLRQCWYELTEDEAQEVRNDPRVLEVETPPEFREDIKIFRMAIQDSNFTKTSSSSGDFVNWGLRRSISDSNTFGTGSFVDREFPYTLTGKGVDVVIQDSGIQIDHPEFEDPNGSTRFVDIDWGQYSSGSFTQNANHNRDFDGHGTHVAGIAAGKTYGWAKNANVMCQKIAGLEGPGDSGTGISPTYAFDAIKAWHLDKGIDPQLGYKRPTVVNMSWGYLAFYQGANLSQINYRGNSYTGSAIDTPAESQFDFGLIYNVFSQPLLMSNVRIASIDTDVEEMIDAGINVCIAAGNRAFKVDVPGGVDYNNYYQEVNGSPVYYHRGSSPNGESAILVGNIDSTPNSSQFDQKAISSETGPGVDVYAPGTNIMSCTSNTNLFNGAEYYLSSTYKQCNISGTSMASPQVAGLVACLLELYPKKSPSEIKSLLINKSGSALYDSGLNDDWGNFISLKGGSPVVLNQPFRGSKPLSIKGITGNVNLVTR
jgi:subtilisin family serine protease